MTRRTTTFLALAAALALTSSHPHRAHAWGTPELVKDIRPGPSSSNPEKLLAIGSRLFFGADDGVAGLEPMATDGSAAGTVALADIWAGPNASLNLGCATCNAIAIGTTVYFSATSGAGGFRLWKSDGTPAGTTLVYSSATASDLVDVAGDVFFAGSTGGPTTSIRATALPPAPRRSPPPSGSPVTAWPDSPGARTSRPATASAASSCGAATARPGARPR